MVVDVSIASHRLSVAQRAGVPPFHVMDVLSAAERRQRTHGDVVSLAPGQPSSPAPAPVREAAARALVEHNLGYVEQLGIPPLREAIAEHYARRYQLKVASDDVVVTTGSSGAFLLAFLSAFDPGDRVALPRPGYPAYRNILTALGCEVVDLPCGEDVGFVPSVAMLEEHEDLAGVVVASPANPTGTVLDPNLLAAVAGHCERRGIQLISDEIYHGIGFDVDLDCAWRSSREAIVVNSFSKYFAMTGWRLGWMLVPPRLRRAVDCLTGNFNICAPVLSQRAALAAFTAESYVEVDAHVHRYRHNRDLLLGGLAALGFEHIAPAEGAFYAWVNVAHLTTDSFALCSRWLEEIGLAVVPGVDFDPVDGHQFVRMSFAGTADDVHEAVRRLGEWLRNC
ncbi:MAG: pyridoxal phosphate-dependent aminotransferase [Sciscionella sp.]